MGALMQLDGDMIIGTRTSRRFLTCGESVHFFILRALHPVWMTTPWATYPILPNEEVSIRMPEQNGPFNVYFLSGNERVTFSYYVS